MAKPKGKGWVPAKQAAAKAAKAHRQEAFRNAKQGKGAAPEYQERKRWPWSK